MVLVHEMTSSYDWWMTVRTAIVWNFETGRAMKAGKEPENSQLRVFSILYFLDGWLVRWSVGLQRAFWLRDKPSLLIRPRAAGRIESWCLQKRTPPKAKMVQRNSRRSSFLLGSWNPFSSFYIFFPQVVFFATRFFLEFLKCCNWDTQWQPDARLTLGTGSEDECMCDLCGCRGSFFLSGVNMGPSLFFFNLH